MTTFLRSCSSLMLVNFCLFYRKVLLGFIFIFGRDVVLERGACYWLSLFSLLLANFIRFTVKCSSNSFLNGWAFRRNGKVSYFRCWRFRALCIWLKGKQYEEVLFSP